MERLAYRFDGGRSVPRRPASFVGVLASGNLEVLVEPIADIACTIEIATPAIGFGDVWQAVAGAFFERHPVAGVRISINDNGATPATVSLRLDQAIDEYLAAPDGIAS